jgi:hypothetical protein
MQTSEKGKPRDLRLARVLGSGGKEEQFDSVIHSRSQVREARLRLPVLSITMFIVCSQGLIMPVLL